MVHLSLHRRRKHRRRKFLIKWGFIAGSAAIVGYGAWAIFTGQRESFNIPAAAAIPTQLSPAGAETGAPVNDDSPAEVLAHRALFDYPAEPALWSAAARELGPTDPEAARLLLLYAIEAEPVAASANLLKDGAAACLAVDDAAGAMEPLRRLPPAERTGLRARYLRATAELELGQRSEASDAGSADGSDAFVYAAARLLAPAKYSSDHAVMVMENLGAKAGPLGREALRVLARRRAPEDRAEAVASAERAADASPAVMDWSYFSEALRRAGRDPSACDAELARLGRLNPAAALEYSAWLMARHQPAAALDWLGQLPAALRDDPLLTERRAVLLAALGSEDRLKAALAADAWGRINPDGLEFAFSARLAAEHNANPLRTSLWGQALAAAGADENSIRGLIRLATDWRWRAETALAYEALLRRNPQDAAPAREYLAWAHRENDTAAWERASLAWREADPASVDARRTWDHLALVRADPGVLAVAVAVAEELAGKDSDDLPLLALARHQQHRDDEALAILEKLPLGQLTRPHAALYYGVLLAAVEPARASRYLDYAARGGDFLPEERVWLRQARIKTGPAYFDNPNQ